MKPREFTRAAAMVYARFTSGATRSIGPAGTNPLDMKRFLLPLLFLLAATPIVAQQNAASIAGVVRDDTGSVIPGVTITVTREGGGAAEVAVSGGEGAFRVDGLRPGAYRVEAVLDGFQTISKEVKLAGGQSIDVAFKLVPAFGETVDVVADAVQTGEVAVLEAAARRRSSATPFLPRRSAGRQIPARRASSSASPA